MPSPVNHTHDSPIVLPSDDSNNNLKKRQNNSDCAQEAAAQRKLFYSLMRYWGWRWIMLR